MKKQIITQMKKFIPALLLIGLTFNACGPTEEEAAAVEAEVEESAQEALDDILKMAEEVAGDLEIDSAALEQLVDSILVEEEAE